MNFFSNNLRLIIVDILGIKYIRTLISMLNLSASYDSVNYLEYGPDIIPFLNNTLVIIHKSWIFAAVYSSQYNSIHFSTKS